MRVRPANPDEVPRIVALAAMMAAESPRWSRLEFSHRKVLELGMHLAYSSGGFLQVAEDAEGDLVGFMAAHCDEHWMSENRVIVELALYVSPDRRGSSAAVRLLQSFKAWSQKQGAKLVLAGCSTGVGDERAVRLYEKVGFRRSSIGLELDPCAIP
jgi:GNAT superfamily N-acetyltransferase